MTSSDDSPERLCGFRSLHLYQFFDEQGTAILPCGKSQCTDKKGKPYTPAATTCTNAQCGKRFRSPCPSIIFCSQECFEATGTQALWDEAIRVKQEHKQRLAKASKTKYLQSDKGKATKKAQNKRCYIKRKEQGKTQAAYSKQKAQKQVLKLATDSPKPPAISSEKPDTIPCSAHH
jgi:hypothetical protein